MGISTSFPLLVSFVLNALVSLLDVPGKCQTLVSNAGAGTHCLRNTHLPSLTRTMSLALAFAVCITFKQMKTAFVQVIRLMSQLDYYSFRMENLKYFDIANLQGGARLSSR